MLNRVIIASFCLLVMAHTGSYAHSRRCYGQTLREFDTSGKSLEQIQRLNESALHSLNTKYADIENSVNTRSRKLLDHMENLEGSLEKKLVSKDSMAAKQLFTNVRDKYEELKASLSAPVTKIIPRPLQEYIPRLDSLQTIMHFLSRSPEGVQGMSAAKLQLLQSLSGRLGQLQGRFNQAGSIQDFLRQREQQLSSQLTKYNMASKLVSVNKNIFYFQQRIAAYKSLFNDRSKLEQAALEYAGELPAFQGFMQKNSYIGQLFPKRQNYGSPKALEGVPSSADVGNSIAQKIGAVGKNIDPQQYLQEQAQTGSDQLSSLKDKIAKAGGNNSAMEIPQFTPNSQKTKSFLKRIELGFNVQSQSSTALLPVLTAFAATAGYRFSDRLVAGIGAAYQLGWGSGFQHIALSNQGAGLRSYLDIKAKGSLWVTGGFEYSYMQEFSKLSDLGRVDIWQKSMLLGLSKKYKIGNQNSNVQLLYDFLAPYETPRGSSFKFRVGYTF